MLALWDAFKENGIEIPYPQREVYIKENVAPHAAPDKIVKMPKEKEETIETEKPKNDNAEE